MKREKCCCKTCKLFYDVEEIGWIDTFNGFYIVFCEDGVTRQIGGVDDEGCGGYQPTENKFIQLDVCDIVQ